MLTVLAEWEFQRLLGVLPSIGFIALVKKLVSQFESIAGVLRIKLQDATIVRDRVVVTTGRHAGLAERRLYGFFNAGVVLADTWQARFHDANCRLIRLIEP